MEDAKVGQAASVDGGETESHAGDAVEKLRTGQSLPSISRRSRSKLSVASSVPSALAPMPGMRRMGSVAQPQGDLLDYYCMSRPLGKGSFGVVCAVQHRKSKQIRALKTIPFSKLQDVGGFKDELEIARQLDHPYIVRLHEVFQTTESIQLVMELCGGGTLAGMLALAQKVAMDSAGPGTVARVPQRLTGSFAWQMLCGIAYLHHHRIIHRDIKPENYLVSMVKGKLALKLADFGLACRFKKGIFMREVLGTPSYVAPEVLSGHYNEKCDVWSIGVVCFVLCTGLHPFNYDFEDTAKVVMQRIRDGKIGVQEQDWEGTNTEARRLVFQMMARDPMLRPGAKQLVAESDWLQRHKDPARSEPNCTQSCCTVS